MHVKSQERAECACGCGERVVRPGASVIRGHNARTPEWKAQFAAARGGAEWVPCANPYCDEQVRVKPHAERRRPDQKHYCGKLCISLAKIPYRNDLQRDCLRLMRRNEWSLAQLASSAGIPYHRLYRWFSADGRTMRRADFEAVAKVLNIDPQRAIAMAGGETLEKRRVRVATIPTEKRLKSFLLPKGSDERKELARKGGSVKGKKRPAGIGKKIAEKRRESEGYEQCVEAHRKRLSSPWFQAQGRLAVHRRRIPHPTVAQLREWAEIDSQKLDIPVEPLVAYYKKCLEKKTGKRLSGRKPMDEERHQFAAELRTIWPQRADGMPEAGYWPVTEAVISQWEVATGRRKKPAEVHTIEKSLLRHMKGCNAAYRPINLPLTGEAVSDLVVVILHWFGSLERDDLLAFFESTTNPRFDALEVRRALDRLQRSHRVKISDFGRGPDGSRTALLSLPGGQE